MRGLFSHFTPLLHFSPVLCWNYQISEALGLELANKVHMDDNIQKTLGMASLPSCIEHNGAYSWPSTRRRNQSAANPCNKNIHT